MIKEFITDVCELLEIETPKVSYDTSHFPTKTTLAQCEPTVNIIYLTKIDKPNPDYVFSIAHELRHIYQYQTDEKFYLSEYKPSNKCSSVEEYNLQIAEVDANAFAAIIMTDFFSIKPQWNRLSDKVIATIEERIKFLLATEFVLDT